MAAYAHRIDYFWSAMAPGQYGRASATKDFRFASKFSLQLSAIAIAPDCEPRVQLDVWPASLVDGRGRAFQFRNAELSLDGMG